MRREGCEPQQPNAVVVLAENDDIIFPGFVF